MAPESGEGVDVGDVLYLHDDVTGFSRKNRMRWCIVTAVLGPNVRVVGRSTTRQDGVPVPASAMPEFDKDGWVPRPPLRIARLDAASARNIGRAARALSGAGAVLRQRGHAVTDARLHELRDLLRAGRLGSDLVAELQSVVRRLARSRTLPRSAAAYGEWNDEAADELFASWYADRLLARGHLQMLLDRAGSVAALHRLAERSLRQHISNGRDRSQAQNLYHRVVTLFEDDTEFELAHDASRTQHRWWRLVGRGDDVWQGDDRGLVAAAWALGDFVVLRYRSDAKKLSPVLDADELKRFVVGLLSRLGAALTAAHVMRALAGRFDLGDVDNVDVDKVGARLAAADDVHDAVIREETARSVLAELSQRQREVLRRTPEETIDQIAAGVSCSVGTVVNEQRHIGELITRMSADEQDRHELLRITSDLLYQEDDE